MKPPRRLLCLGFALLGSVAGQGITPEQVGDWLLVNGNFVLKLEADGTMTARNSGEKAKITLKDDGSFSWGLQQPRTGTLRGDRLLLDNPLKDAPAWLARLEFRRAESKLAEELIEFALRQQNQVVSAFANVRTKSVEAAVRNNLRQLSAAADQYFLEHGKTTTTFSELVGPGKLIKQINAVDGEDYSKLEFRLGGEALTVTTSSGVVVSYDPYPSKP